MRKNSGFTLLELMVTVALIAILAAIAIPDMISWMPDYRLKSAAKDIHSNFQKARFEAIKRNASVIINFTTGDYTPDGRVGSYVIFVDKPPKNGIYDAGETILVQATMPRNVSLYTGGTTFSGTTTTGYDPRGLVWKSRWGRVAIKNNNSKYCKASLSAAGYVNLKTSNDGVNWN